MKRLHKLSPKLFLLITLAISSCSPSSNIKKEISGKYASASENNFDYFRDTIEVRQTDDGKFDIQMVANWSSAKKDDPQRPNKNKKAGVWNNYGKGDVEVATMQESDNTLRITDPISGTVRILKFDREKKTMEDMSNSDVKTIYFKVP